ncbi:unnamed protein product [Oncorhynchus mykiss]|uniref:Transcription elongation factor Spt6 YqgF domain-containing protein n=1 Tax=Oncorhynchus mykiss TaxID=8022 RepID=A0A060ZDU1_ONCMY|nr:unnamed protein product [Oncorhynchus mykiss]
MEDIKRTVSELEQESSLPAVGVELVDNELAMLYMNSTKSQVIMVDRGRTMIPSTTLLLKLPACYSNSISMTE